MTLSPIELSLIVSAASVVGGVLVKLTPTKVDDAWWEALMEKKRAAMRVLGR